jgi:hypothetical protein
MPVCLRIALTLVFVSFTASSAWAQLSLPGGTNFTASLTTFQLQLAATGGTAPYHYSLTPGATVVPGLRVQDGPPLPTSFPASVTGGLIGVLNTPGVFNTSIRVTDSLGATLDKAITITVASFNQATLVVPRGVLNAPYTAFTFDSVGAVGAVTWSATNLPSGMNLSVAGVLSGTPTASGAFTPLITSTDNGTVPATVRTFGYQLIIDPWAIITAGLLPVGTVNSPYSVTFEAPSCVNCVWTLAGGLPSGLTFVNGVLSGTPTSSTFAATSLVVTATGTNGTVSKGFALRIMNTTPQPLSISGAASQTQLGTTIINFLSAQGGTPPYTVSVDSGALPHGISLKGTNDDIGGTFAPGFYLLGRTGLEEVANFTLKVTDSLSASATLAVTWSVRRLQIGYTSLPISGTPLVYGLPYSQKLLGLGGTSVYTWTALGPLPPGLTLNPNNGRIIGTPTNTGSFNTPLQLSDNTGHIVTGTLFFTIAGPTATTINFGLGNFTLTRGTSLTTGTNLSGGTGPYTVEALSPLPPGFALLSGNALPGTFPDGWAISGIALQAGTFPFTLKATDSLGNIGVRTFTFTVNSMSILTSLLQQASVGVAYSLRLIVEGNTGAATWSVSPGSAMPPGLALTAAGRITGTPTTAGVFSFTVVATDAASNAVSRTFSLTISNLAITDPEILPNATWGVPYTRTFTPSGNIAPLTWTATGLPSGFTMSPTGTLSGTATFTGGPFVLTVTATDGANTITRRFVLSITRAAPTLLSVSALPVFLNDLVVGQPVFFTLPFPTGGTPPYTWVLAPGSSLPPGMRLVVGDRVPTAQTTAGATVLSGAPTAAGNFVFDLVATDAVGRQIVRTFTVHVSTLALLTSLKTPRAGEAYVQQLTTVGGTGPYTYTATPNNVTVPALPPGLTLSSSGLLSGTPTSTGNYTMRLQVTDSTGETSARFVTLSVFDFVNGGANGLMVNASNPIDASIGFSQLQSFSLVRSGFGGITGNWSLVGGAFAPGVTLTGSTICCFPTAPGTYVYRMRGTDASSPTLFAEREFTARVVPMQIVSPPVAMGFAYSQLPDAHVGEPYSFRIRLAGGTRPYTFAPWPFSPLPAGLTLDSTGLISGTPTQAGESFFFAFTVTDSAGATFTYSQLRLSITPSGVPLPLSEAQLHPTRTLPMGVNVTGLFTILDEFVQGGVKPYSWDIASGALPPGLRLIQGGSGVPGFLGGIATLAGVFNVSLSVQDAVGQSLTLPITLTIVDHHALDLSLRTLPNGVVGTPYTATLTPSGGTGPYNVVAGTFMTTLPPGLSLSAAGVLSGTPASPGNFRFRVFVLDTLNVEFFDYRVTIDNAQGHAKGVSLSPTRIVINHTQGAPGAPIPLAINLTNGSLPFNAMVSGIPGATVSASSGSAPTTINVDLNLAALAQGTYYGMVGVSAPNSANVFDIAPITINVGPPPVVQAIAVTPNTGAGTRQIFTATYSDSAGVSADLKRAMLRIGASNVNACVVDYNAITATARLFDDAGVPGAAAALGTGGTLSNSQCTLNLATSSAMVTLAGPAVSANTLTLALDISFATAFAGPQPLAARAMSLAGPNTGFVPKGTWTVGLPAPGVQAISIAPNTGSGSNQAFVLAYSDSAGVAADLKVARVRFVPAGGGAMCMVDYNAMTNLVRLMGDDGITWSPFTPFGAGTLTNSQCTLVLPTSNAVRSGTDLALTLALTFKPAFAGAKNIDMRANSNFGPTTGFVNRGTWTVP